MKLTIAILLSIALVPVFTGCKSSKVEKQDPVTGEEYRLTLLKPADQTIRQGEMNKVAIAINRDNFSDPVTVRFDNLPRGIHVMESEKKIESGENIVSYTLHADPDADLVGKHLVNVTVEGPDGLATTETFALTVKGKD